jgi:peptide/nickel transport system substrate-binding protein
MSKRRIGRREFLRLSAVAGGVTVISACLPGSTTPSPAPQTSGKFELGKLEGGTVVLDASKFPKTFKEAPELAALVQQGKLPAVAQRIGSDPLVIKPVHEIGKYGGMLRRAYTGAGDRQNANRFAAGPDNLLYWDWEWKGVVPNIAKGFELSGDGRTLTLTLRKGMKWSDGEPFTADDILFWYNDMYLNPEVVGSPTVNLQINGKDVQVQKVDDYTVRYVSPDPNYLLPQLMAGWTDIGGASFQGQFGMGGYAAKHYLQQFHPKYAGAAAANKAATDAGVASWALNLKNKNNWTRNADLPVITPWKTKAGAEITTATWTLERNPYSIWVDTDGNQLPYIGTIAYNQADNLEVLNLRAVSGELDFQDRHLGVDKLTVLVENQTRGKYKLHLDPGQSGDFGIRINLAYEDDAEIGSLLRTADFRRAMSLGIDRQQVIEAFFSGTGTASSVAPADNNKYFPGAQYRTMWATHDVKQANDLLDKLGYTKKDSAGYRQRKVGKGRLQIEYMASPQGFADFVAIGEMMKQHWVPIGLEMVIKSVSSDLETEIAVANKAQLMGQSVGSEDLFLLPDTTMPFVTNNYQGGIGIPYAKWFQSGGKDGKEPFAELKALMDVWRRGYAAPEAQRIELGKQFWKMNVEQVFLIGVMGMGLVDYGLHLAKTNLGNVPDRYVNAQVMKTPSNALPMTFYYTQ